MSLINKIVVHCSDSPHRGDTAADVHRWHQERGWSGIGYHFTIDEEGMVEQGRPPYWAGAHVRGHNSNSLGVMLFGIDEFTPVQKEALRSLLDELLNLYPEATLYGHRDLDHGKTCPNFDVRGWYYGD